MESKEFDDVYLQTLLKLSSRVLGFEEQITEEEKGQLSKYVERQKGIVIATTSQVNPILENPLYWPGGVDINTRPSYWVNSGGGEREYILRGQDSDTGLDVYFPSLRKLGIDFSEVSSESPSQNSIIRIRMFEDSEEVRLNLKLYKVAYKPDSDLCRAPGSIENYLYILDRDISERLKGKGIGKDLLLVADQVAQDNNCKLIFTSLSAEKPEDQPLLERGHRKMGYKVVKSSTDWLGTEVAVGIKLIEKNGSMNVLKVLREGGITS